MTETLEAPAFPVVKMKRSEDTLEGIYFEGGRDNAEAIIKWVESHGETATYSVNHDAVWSETLRIKVPDGEGMKSRFAIPGSWIVRTEDGDYRRLSYTAQQDLYTIVGGNIKEGEDAWPWVELAASICHEANRELQIAAGDDTVSPHWKSAPNWQKESALEGVQNALKGLTPKEMHEAWMESKLEDGWEYGETKNAVAKTHPCLVPYEELDENQKLKDAVFLSIIKAFKDQALLG